MSKNTYNWNSEKEAKAQYPEFEATFKSLLGQAQVSYCYSKSDTDFQRPRKFLPTSVDDPTSLAILKLEQTYDAQVKSFHKDFDKAIGILRSLFTYGCKAQNDINSAEMRCEIGSTPEDKFRAALSAITSTYAPKGVTDVAEIRKQMQDLTDQGGFRPHQIKKASI